MSKSILFVFIEQIFMQYKSN